MRIGFKLAENKLSRVGGWLDKVKLRLTQPQVELEAWAELGNKSCDGCGGGCCGCGCVNQVKF